MEVTVLVPTILDRLYGGAEMNDGEAMVDDSVDPGCSGLLPCLPQCTNRVQYGAPFHF